MIATLNGIVDSITILAPKDCIWKALESYAKVHFLDFIGVFAHSEKVHLLQVHSSMTSHQQTTEIINQITCQNIGSTPKPVTSPH